MPTIKHLFVQTRAFIIKLFDHRDRNAAQFAFLKGFCVMGKAITDQCFKSDGPTGFDKANHPLIAVGQVVHKFYQATSKCVNRLCLITGVIKRIAFGQGDVFNRHMDKLEILVRQVVEQGKLPHTTFTASRKIRAECIACCLVHDFYP